MKRESWACALFLAAVACTLAIDAQASAPIWQQDLLTQSGPSLRLTDVELDALLVQGDDATLSLDAYGDDLGAPRRWWPLALSAVLPGLGETVTGHRRGWFMMAADAGLWYGVWDKHDEGEQWEDDFEAFALEHWSEEEWERALQQGDLEDYFNLPAGTSKDDIALYVTREEDEREWFENLGKWDVFSWGWREYWEDDFDPGDPSNPDYVTPLRAEYLTMRGNSNDAFATRDTLFNVAVLFRVFSIVQMAYLEGFVGGRFESAGASAQDPPQMGWTIEPARGQGTRIGWKVSY